MPGEQGVVIRTKRFLAVHDSHPAVTYHGHLFLYLLCRAKLLQRRYVFYAKIFWNFCGFCKRIQKSEVSHNGCTSCGTSHCICRMFLSIQVTDSLRISVSFIANVAAGCLFGPVMGFVCGGIGDIIQFVLKPTGPYFPGWTLSAALAGFIYGAFLYKKFPQKVKTKQMTQEILVSLKSFM